MTPRTPDPRHVHWTQVAPRPWHNGGGFTRELHAHPAGSDWQVRISVADVESDGPFSAFPGVQRWFAVLQGAGVDLTVDGVTQRLHRADAPLAFDGAARVACRLVDGPTRDLNLMLREADGRMEAAVDAQDWAPAATQCGLFTAVAGTCDAVGARHDVASYTLLWFDRAPVRLAFTAAQRPAAGIGWWLAATPHRRRVP